jgi:hypothetical protein
MTRWASVKHAIRTDLNSRNLAKPRLRLSALDNVETLLVSSYRDFRKNPGQLVAIGKDAVKKRLSELKDNGRLNGAESSVLNDIFHYLDQAMTSDTSSMSGRESRAAAAEAFKPDRVRLLLIAEAPPNAVDRYFYFDNVTKHDWLYRGVVEGLFGERPGRFDKARVLSELRRKGVFLIDLKPDPIDGSPLATYVPDLVSRCKALHADHIILIKASVFDAAYSALTASGLPIINKRIPFPSSGQQGNFRRAFAEALSMGVTLEQ